MHYKNWDFFSMIFYDYVYYLLPMVYIFRDFDSCGFEHVFVGESREHHMLGFHNWLQFYLQEQKGNIDYRGYFRRGTVRHFLDMI